MKKLLLTLFTAFFCLQVGVLMATENPECPDNSCFDTQIISKETQDNCSTYTLEISQNGDCRYALSHYSIAVGCGQVTDVSNSEGWAMEVGTTDPSTGITGIKVDDIKDFGEDTSPQTFTVTYTICQLDDCEAADLVPAKVAYKASTCVHYQDLAPLYTPMSAEIVATDASCPGTADGALDLQLSGGEEPFAFSWNNDQASEDIEGLTAGIYSVSITDASGQELSLQATVQEAEAMELQLSADNPACGAEYSGSISLSLSGGNAPYTYAWNNGESSQNLENLEAGTYSVTVTDANGCTAIATASIANPNSIVISQTALLQPDCLGNAGSISVEASQGTAPYTYEWSNGESGESISNLSPGVYTVTVSDANGCSSSQSFTINAPSAPELTISGDDCGSTLIAALSGGTAPYTYAWSTGDTGASLDYTEAGTYELTVTDANGCSSTESITTDAPSAAISLQIAAQNPVCNGDQNGSIDLTVEGGSAPYTYEWSNGETGQDLDGLSAGTYTVTVTDEAGCTSTASVNLSQPRAIFIRTLEVIHANCLGEDGSVSVEGSFGSAPYTYEWSNGETGQSISGLESGYYTVTVTDANGCSSQRRIRITQDTPPSVSISSSGCGSEFELSTVVSGGSEPYTYEWNTGETDSGISVGAGTYDVSITDANGCSSSASISLQEADSPLSLQASVSHVSCAGGSNGSASLQVSGGVAPYTYDWSHDNDQQGPEASRLDEGVYSVQVSDANGCSEIFAFTISEPAPISITAVVENNENCLQANGSIEVHVNGGVSPYTYEWNTGESSPQLYQLAGGNYTLTIEDANNCVAIRSFTVEDTADGALLTATLPSFSDSLVCQGSTLSLPITFTGEGPYTFSYTDGQAEHSISTSSNPYLLELSPESNSSYSLLSLSNSCGEGTVSGLASVLLSECEQPEQPKQAKDCGDGCFSTNIVRTETNGNCKTITLQVNSDGSCRYELSHFNIALECGTASNVSNSEGWPMEVNALDPTTGIYGIKVDDIKKFGKGSTAESFTVTYTICSNDAECQETLAESLEVGYKAGTCVYLGTATESIEEEDVNFGDGIIVGIPGFDIYPNPYSLGQDLNIRFTHLERPETANVRIYSLTGLIIHQQEYEVNPEEYIISLQIEHMDPGTYLVEMEIQGRILTKQLYVL